MLDLSLHDYLPIENKKNLTGSDPNVRILRLGFWE